MEGERDSVFVQACSHTMGGGIEAVTFSGDLLCMHEWKDEVAALDADFLKWHDDLSGVGQGGIRVNMDARHREVHGGQTPCPGDPGGASRDEVNPDVVEWKPQIASIARAMRETHVGFAVQPPTADDASVTSSAMFANLPAGGCLRLRAGLRICHGCESIHMGRGRARIAPMTMASGMLLPEA